MSLAKATLRALETVVGPENIRTDPATLASYAWNGGPGSQPGPKFKHWPAAVVLPGNTEDVAGIVRACVADDLKFRPLSTGNGCMYVSNQPGVIVLDLVRMNRILKLDRFNQMAVIEPYVTAGQLQAEAMKQGLTCHIVGAGQGHSPLASATSMLGVGITGASTGSNVRNMLSLEWVTPQGEIVRIGTSGEEDWFSEEGPGLGFRGMVRGFKGAHGALGIFTRIGYKLYPWAGAKAIKTTGTVPQNGMPMSDNMRFFAPAWTDAEQMSKAVIRLNRTGLVFALLRMPPSSIGYVLTSGNYEYVARLRNRTLPEVARSENRHACQILTLGHSEAQAAHQEQVVRSIVAETGGRMLALDPMDEQILVRGLVTSQYVPRVYRGGMGASSFGVADSWNLWPKALQAAEELVREDIKSGLLATTDRDGHWAWTSERQIWTEHIVATRSGPDGQAVAISAFLRHFHRMHQKRLGVTSFVVGPILDLFGRNGHENVWMRRVKNMLDPQWRADATLYASRRPMAIAKFWPILQPLVLSKAAKPLLTFLLRTAFRKAAKKAPSKFEA